MAGSKSTQTRVVGIINRQDASLHTFQRNSVAWK